MDEHITLRRLAALEEYWQSNPPIHQMIAAYFGIGKKTKAANIAEASEFLPVETMKENEFDSMLADLGIKNES